MPVRACASLHPCFPAISDRRIFCLRSVSTGTPPCAPPLSGAIVDCRKPGSETAKRVDCVPFFSGGTRPI
eukprot:scaffold40869_cov66-Phaeocystis_antarctica.AAC.2